MISNHIVLAVLFLMLATPAAAQLTFQGRPLAEASSQFPGFHSHNPTEEVALKGLVIVAGAADSLTTWRCLRQDRCREVNPFLNWALTNAGQWAFVLTKALSTAAIVAIVDYLYRSDHPKWARALAIGTGATWGGAAVWNAQFSKP